MFDNYPDILGITELTEMLSIGRNTAYKLINDGVIKSIKIGNKTHKIPKKWVIDYIEKAC